jgi:flagellar protein FliO/FliZ
MTSGTYFQFLFALAVVLALLAGLSWAVRRFGFTGGGFTLQPGKKRIAIVEMTAIDPKRRLVLVRRDQTEHLILLGTGTETVVETGIAAPAPAAPAPAAPTAPPPADASATPRAEAEPVS